MRSKGALLRGIAIGCLALGASTLPHDAAEKAAKTPTAAAGKAQSLPSDPDKAWSELEQSFRPPPMPAEWAKEPPTDEQRDAFFKTLGAKSVDVANQAREFYTRFPDHPRAEEAKERQKQFLQQAVSFGNTNAVKLVESLLNEEERLALKVNSLHRRAMEKQAEGTIAVLNDLEAGIRDLMKEHPNSPALWDQLITVAEYGDPEKSEKILAEIIESKVASEAAKERAQGILKQRNAIGHPLEMTFTAADGTEVDIQKMDGKVVLIDFWAAWCGPCIASLPEVVELYKKYHSKGFEIVGINLDPQKEAMEKTMKRFDMTWPQYFDGKGWGNKLAAQFNITAIPAMWLVDKKGNLRTTNAREDLEGQITKLLAEKE